MELFNVFICSKKHDRQLKIEEIESSKTDQPASETKGHILQFFTNSSVYVLMIEHGVHTAWTLPGPHLTSEKSEFPVTKAQGGWIASLFSLSTILGIMLCPLFMDRMERKYTMLLFFIPRLISWILMILAKSYITLYAARLLAGVGTRGLYSLTAVYIG
ncbi:uncharacterized protein LOC117176006 [Belonocnema kinseyi]|uniref:uncharacterized protein LOC117176006 n=1 Tax=Belonocnema kinseyi TaxID=2817044 RepID=UPI00143D2BD2|nr:uncharacterized protein LOC117176006 [Belonocnema kinseyi]